MNCPPCWKKFMKLPVKPEPESMLTNLKIQVDFENNVTIDDKMEKYR
jgi:hypothetical protein